MSKSIPYRFSLIKRRGNISFENFINITKHFIECTEFVWPKKTIIIELFTKPPHSITSYQEELLEFLAEERKSLIFTTLDDIKDVTESDFEKAQFVSVRIVPNKKISHVGCAWLEFKGWLPTHAIFHTQPENEMEIIHGRFLENEEYKLHYKQGDGTEKNHSITYS